MNMSFTIKLTMYFAASNPTNAITYAAHVFLFLLFGFSDCLRSHTTMGISYMLFIHQGKCFLFGTRAFLAAICQFF